MDLKLGKLPATHDRRDLLLTSYLEPDALPELPKNFGHEKVVNDYMMLGNDRYGDCVFAGAAHETMMWSQLGGHPARFTDAVVLSDYSAVTGFNRHDPNSDRGTSVRDALKYRQQTGIKDAMGRRHKIGAYVALEPGNIIHVLTALYLFGAVGIGFEVPDTAMEQFSEGKRWSIRPGAKVEGGHYVPLVSWRSHILGCVTWGRVQTMTRTFFERYCDEAWAILSPEMLKLDKSPEGFDLSQLQADLAALGR